MKLDQAKLAEMLDIIERLDLRTLAQAGAHEYDSEISEPPFRSSGQVFLVDVRRSFVDWVRRQGRFPATDAEVTEAAGQWADETKGSSLVQAFADLDLVYSGHRDAATQPGLTVLSFQQALREVAEQIVVTLTDDYGPLA